jgi:hypothetical protein
LLHRRRRRLLPRHPLTGGAPLEHGGNGPHPWMRIPVAYLSSWSSSSTSGAHSGGGGALLLPSTATPVAPRPPSGRDPSLHGGNSQRPAAPTWTAGPRRRRIHDGVHSADPPPPRAWRLLLADVGATVASPDRSCLQVQVSSSSFVHAGWLSGAQFLSVSIGLSSGPSLLLPSTAPGFVCVIIVGDGSGTSI